jgi:hypothetical protein
LAAATATMNTETVGIFRILAVLDKCGITPTLALDKAMADHYPTLVKEGQKRSAEDGAAERSTLRVRQHVREGSSKDKLRLEC